MRQRGARGAPGKRVDVTDGSPSGAYDAALAQHALGIAVELQRIDASLRKAREDDIDADVVARLETMRVLLISGLFDREFYLERYPDVREASVDPLWHYVAYGDREGRLPNPAFVPRYYRRRNMVEAEAGRNALQHYIETGERSGARPNAVFDPSAYLAANPLPGGDIDRPLFRFLKVGLAAGEQPRSGVSPATLQALDYIEQFISEGGESQLLLAVGKRKLIEGLGVTAGFALLKTLLDRADFAEIRWKRLAGLGEISRRGQGAFCETAPGGEPFLVPPPTVIGEGDQRPLAAATRSMFVACLVGARVRARSNLIEVDDLALLDYEGDELSRFDDQLDFDPSVFQATGEGAWVITPTGDGAAVEIEEAFTLLGVRPYSFGHWMIEYLPKYIAASLSGALPRVPLLIDAAMPETHREALELMLPEGVEIIELAPFTTARVRRLWCAPSQAFFPINEVNNERFHWEDFVMPPARFLPIIREMARRVERVTAPPTWGDRLFIARGPHQHRELVNGAAIESAAEARGFRVVYPLQFGFAEQARLARHARYLLGQTGSAMFLLFFAGPGTRLCLLSSVKDVLVTQTDLIGLLSAIGVDVTVFTGPCAPLDPDRPWNSNFEVDTEALCRFLDQWLDRDASRPIAVATVLSDRGA